MRRILFIGPTNISFDSLSKPLNPAFVSIDYYDTVQKAVSISKEDIIIFSNANDLGLNIADKIPEAIQPNTFFLQFDKSPTPPVLNQLKIKPISAHLNPIDFYKTITRNLNIPIYFLLKTNINEDQSFKISIEIAKANRSHTPLTFVFLPFSVHYSKTNNEYSNDIENELKNSFRISDEILILDTGVLMILFATSTNGASHKINSFFNKTENSVISNFEKSICRIITCTENSEINIDSLITTINSKSISEQMQISLPSQNIAENLNKLFVDATSAKKIKTQKVIINNKPTTNLSENPPTYLGGLLQLIYDDAVKSEEIENFLQSETNLNHVILGYQNFILNREQHTNKIDSKYREELHLLCTFACLEITTKKYLLNKEKNYLHEKAVLYTIGYDMAKITQYPIIVEVFLGLFLRLYAKILIENSDPNKFATALQTFHPNHYSLDKCLADVALPTCSEIINSMATQWNIDESISEAAMCAFYDSEPQFNPQLTAIIHATEVIYSHLYPSRIANLPFIKEACDELRLKNRSLLFQSLPSMQSNTSYLKEKVLFFENL